MARVACQSCSNCTQAHTWWFTYLWHLCRNSICWTNLLYIHNLLRSGNVRWNYRLWSSLVQVMAWYLMAPSHYLNQCWLIVNESLRNTWMQGLTLSIWFTCPGHVVLKIYVPCRNFHMPSPVKLIYTARKITTCPDWKITCPVGHVIRKVCVPWDKIYMPQACGHPLMWSPGMKYQWF